MRNLTLEGKIDIFETIAISKILVTVTMVFNDFLVTMLALKKA